MNLLKQKNRSSYHYVPEETMIVIPIKIMIINSYNGENTRFRQTYIIVFSKLRIHL